MSNLDPNSESNFPSLPNGRGKDGELLWRTMYEAWRQNPFNIYFIVTFLLSHVFLQKKTMIGTKNNQKKRSQHIPVHPKNR